LGLSITLLIVSVFIIKNGNDFFMPEPPCLANVAGAGGEAVFESANAPAGDVME